MLYTKHLASDLVAGMVVFLVAVPLCLGIALASGAPLMSGMVTGVIGGIVVGVLSKSQISVCGPAAGLTAIVLNGISQIGSFEGFLVAVIIAGIFQMILGILKAGIVAYYIPSNVIRGMLCAIGIIIIMKQFGHFVGYDGALQNASGGHFVDGENAFSIFHQIPELFHPGVCLTGFLSLLSMVAWDNYKPMRLKLFPGALLAVLVGVLCNEIFKLGSFSNLIIESKYLVSLPTPTDIHSFFGQFVTPDFSYISIPQVWVLALTIGIVASIETLLTIEATDKIDPQKRVTPTNRELLAQGIGNSLCGLLGGIPLTSVIVRSSANINAGGKTKQATIFHGVLLIIGILLFPKLLNFIPLTSLAAILLVTGFKLTAPSVFKKMFMKKREQWLPFIFTIIAIVVSDLLIGVLIGIAISLVTILIQSARNSYFFHKEKYKDGELIHIVLAHEVSFLNKAAIILTLSHIPEKSYVLLDAQHTTYIDEDVLEIIREFAEETAQTREIKVILRGFKREYKIDNNDHIFFESIDEFPALSTIQKGINDKDALTILGS